MGVINCYPDRRNGRHQDDSAIFTDVREGLLGHEELAFHVDAENLIDVLGFDVRDVVEVLDAAVRHHDVDCAKLIDGRLEEMSNRLGL